ncbi:MAG: metalloregulator ArsR/SmtB family transcription factor [Nitrospirota bacterium]
MGIFFDDNPTRKNIIILLKKSGGMSIEELSRNINITPMGIRQHLMSLEKKGIVTYHAKKHGIGRPGFIYKLTEEADELFPKSYDSFAIDVLRDIEKYDGKEKIDKIFRWRRDRLFKLKKKALSGSEDFDGILNALKGILESEGHFVEINKHNGSYHLMQYNCPISKIALEFKAACKHELQMYKDLLGRDVKRTRTQSEGNSSCLYIIPEA